MRLATRRVAYDVWKKEPRKPLPLPGQESAGTSSDSNLVWEGSQGMSRAWEQREMIVTTGLEGTGGVFPVWGLAGLVGVATMAVYCSAIPNGFVEFDDWVYVTHN